MMTRTLLTSVIVLTAVALVRADDKPPPAKPPAPNAATLRMKDGKLLIEYQVAVTVYQPVTQTQAVIVNGKTETRTVTVMVPVTKIERRQAPGDGYEVQDLAGTRVAPDELANLLAKDAPALMSADGKPIDPSYLKGAKEGTLIVVPVKKEEPKKEP